MYIGRRKEELSRKGLRKSSMESLRADIRQSIRFLLKNPGFSAVCVAVLALGIGANTAIFSAVNAVLLQPLPYPHSERILRLTRHFKEGDGDSVSIARFMAWRHAPALESAATYDGEGPGVNLTGGDRPEQLKAIHVSADYFRVFGTSTAIGRTFTQAEDLPHGPKATILSYGLWKRRFGGDRSLVGRTISLNGDPYLVIGVLPEKFVSEQPVDLYIAQQADPNSTSPANYLRAAARLKPGATLADAQSQLRVIGEQFRASHSNDMSPDEIATAKPLQEALVGEVRLPLLILLGAVGFVLLIACANVANLLLARATSRQKEIAIRTAMGANRWRLVRQLLTESLALSLVGGVAGFVLGIWALRGIIAFAPPDLTRLITSLQSAPVINWQVLGFTFGVALLTGLLFGVLPALHVSLFDVNSSLKEASGRSGTGLRQNRTRSALVVAEVALALILLVGAGLMIRTFAGLKNAKLGFETHNILTLKTAMSGGRYDSTAQVAALTQQVLLRLEALPGVKSAATALMLPSEGGVDLPLVIEGRPLPKGEQAHGDEEFRSVAGHYFESFSIPLLRGRLFDERDNGKSEKVVIINEAFAKKYWARENPVGKILSVGKGMGKEFEEPPREIVGVVGSVRETGIKQGDTPVMYIPASQAIDNLTKLANSVIPMSWVVRTASDPQSLSPAIQKEFAAVDAQLPVATIRTMDQVIAESTARQNFNMLLLTIFAGIALALASVGIYALMSYSVQQRTQEIGIRMALGAKQSDMQRLVLGQGMRLTAIGVVIGLAGAYGLMRLLAQLLFGVSATDPLTFAAVALLLTLVASLACWIPAYRATQVDPIIALRYE